MTPQERQLVDDLFDRLAKVESAPRDPDAIAAMQEGLRKAPNAIYALVQTVLVQDEALKRANARIQELEQAHAPEQQQSGGFLDSMRDTIFGKEHARLGAECAAAGPEPSGLEQRPGAAADRRAAPLRPGPLSLRAVRAAMANKVTDKAASALRPSAAAAARSSARRRQRRPAWWAARCC